MFINGNKYLDKGIDSNRLLAMLVDMYLKDKGYPFNDVKRWAKKIYKSMQKKETPIANMVRANRLVNEWDSGIDIWVFDGLTETEALEGLEWAGYDIEASTWHSPYDCTGKRFWSKAYAHKVDGKVWVTQQWGYDV